MAKSDKGQQASSKPNKGQDEQIHAFVNPADGSTVEATMREFRAPGGLRDQGYQDQGVVGGDDAAEAPES